MTKRLKALSAAVLLATLCPGCMTFKGPEGIRQTITTAKGLELEDQMGIRINALGMISTAFYTNFSIPVWHLSLLEVGTYDVMFTAPEGTDLRLRPLELPGWERSVYTREGYEESLIFVQQNDSAVKAMVVVILSGSELSIVHLRGNIHKFFEDPDDTARVLERTDQLARLLTTVGKVPRYLRKANRIQRANEDAIRRALQGAGWIEPTEQPADDEARAGPGDAS